MRDKDGFNNLLILLYQAREERMMTPEELAECIVSGRRVAPREFRELLEKEGIASKCIKDIGESCPFIDFIVSETPIEVKTFCGGKKLKIVTENHRKLGKEGVYVFRLGRGRWRWLEQQEVESLFHPICKNAYQKWANVIEKSKDIKSLIERLKEPNSTTLGA